MPNPRKSQINLIDTSYYQCVSRYVRHYFLHRQQTIRYVPEQTTNSVKSVLAKSKVLNRFGIAFILPNTR